MDIIVGVIVAMLIVDAVLRWQHPEDYGGTKRRRRGTGRTWYGR